MIGHAPFRLLDGVYLLFIVGWILSITCLAQKLPNVLNTNRTFEWLVIALLSFAYLIGCLDSERVAWAVEDMDNAIYNCPVAHRCFKFIQKEVKRGVLDIVIDERLKKVRKHPSNRHDLRTNPKDTRM